MPDDTDAPAVLSRLVQQAEQAGASDVHLQMSAEGAAVSFRLDGLLAPVSHLPTDLAERVFGRIKFLARLKTYDGSLPQDGRIERIDAGTAQDVRVATYPTVTGEKIVLRLFNQTVARPLGDLGLPDIVVAELDTFLRGNAGLLLLTGPAGSGKTTTIYACLRHLLGLGGRHIITVEDPVEQILPGVMQTEVNEARGLGFAVAARHLLRQDPQVLVLGEVRDEETAMLAVRAALTGHVVISTLHAGSCRGVFERLFVMCPDRYAVVAATALVLNQRLLRRVCPACASAGCDVCLRTGYRGRVPAVEWVRVDEALRARLRTGGTEAVAPAQPLATTARELVARGLSDAREYERVFGPSPG
jgi:type II secretory ATPase GspE/PulE/Tfp pilus assembly ATPase PilB-like protein